MTSAAPGKRGRPAKRPLDYVHDQPAKRRYLFVKARMKTGRRKEEAIADAMTHFRKDRTTIQRNIAPFFKAESAWHELAQKLATFAGVDAYSSASTRSAGLDASAKAFFDRFDRIFSEEERRQLDGATVPLVSKLMDDRDESERSKQRRYHKSKKKSAAGKSAE